MNRNERRREKGNEGEGSGDVQGRPSTHRRKNKEGGRGRSGSSGDRITKGPVIEKEGE